MRVTHLKVKNVGMVADANIELNKPLLIFYGEIRQGKSTLLNAVRWVCGGSFPADIIRHDEKEASIELGLDGGCITRSWYRTKATDDKPSEIKARAVQFVRGGKPVANPVAELKRLMNPFLLDQDFLRNKTELERKQYFAELFAVDTSDLDTELFDNQRKASDLRAKLTGYGEIDLTPVESVDTAALRGELAKVRAEHADKILALQRQRSEMTAAYQKAYDETARKNQEIRKLNQQIDADTKYQAELYQKVARLKAELRQAEEDLLHVTNQLAINVRQSELGPPLTPDYSQIDRALTAVADTADLEAKLQNAAAQNVKAEQFKLNQKRDQERKADESALKALEDRARQIKKEKISRLEKVSETSGVPGLAFDGDGNFTYEGTAAGMLSTSQIMRLSSALSALYPEGLAVELLDRGESLGRSIFDYVKHAEAKKVSVLATVVGQRPAEVPEKVGVFCVKDGVIFKDGEAA